MNSMEMQRRLRDSGLSPQACYIVNFLYEMVVEQQKQLDVQASVSLALAESMQGFAHLSEANMALLQRGNKTEGVDISSVANDPEV